MLSGYVQMQYQRDRITFACEKIYIWLSHFLFSPHLHPESRVDIYNVMYPPKDHSYPFGAPKIENVLAKWKYSRRQKLSDRVSISFESSFIVLENDAQVTKI